MIISTTYRVVAFSLLVSILAPLVIRSTSLIHFFVNREYIARELCRERDVESSCCKGKCYLKEKLNETSRQDQPSESTVEVRMTELPFLIQSLVVICDIFCIPQAREGIHYSFSIKENITSVNTKPPCGEGV